MPIDAITKDFLASMEQAMAEALQRAFAEGEREAARKIWQAAGAVLPSMVQSNSRQEPVINATATTFVVTDSDVVDVENVDSLISKRRAPKGLTDIALKQVLFIDIGLPMEEVQRRAVTFDSRISEKTVYNTLYRGPDYVQDSRGHWRLRAHGDQLVLTNAPNEREGQEALTAH